MAECLNWSDDEKTTDDEEETVELSRSSHLSVGASSSTIVDVNEMLKQGKKKRLNSKKSKNNEDNTGKPSTEPFECPICLGPAVLPMQILCGHIFCFLCIKGAVQTTHGCPKCPMCRTLVLNDFDENPILLKRPEPDKEMAVFDDGNQWFYECKTGGWWQYEKRTSEEIEYNYQLNHRVFNVLICGTMYTIDLNRGVQYDTINSTKRRKIKRENATNLLVKGIAGVY